MIFYQPRCFVLSRNDDVYDLIINIFLQSEVLIRRRLKLKKKFVFLNHKFVLRGSNQMAANTFCVIINILLIKYSDASSYFEAISDAINY